LNFGSSKQSIASKSEVNDCSRAYLRKGASLRYDPISSIKIEKEQKKQRALESSSKKPLLTEQ